MLDNWRETNNSKRWRQRALAARLINARHRLDAYGIGRKRERERERAGAFKRPTSVWPLLDLRLAHLASPFISALDDDDVPLTSSGT